jgi:hypothetical protein
MNSAELLIEAVAPVKISEEGCGDALADLTRRGSVACVNRNAPLAENIVAASVFVFIQLEKRLANRSGAGVEDSCLERY